MGCELLKDVSGGCLPLQDSYHRAIYPAVSSVALSEEGCRTPRVALRRRTQHRTCTSSAQPKTF